MLDHPFWSGRTTNLPAVTRITTRLRWAVARYPRQVDYLVVGLLTLGTLSTPRPRARA